MARVWPAIAGLGVGAYGLNAVQNTSMPDIVRGFAGSLIPSSGGPAASVLSGSGEGVANLQKEVERLQHLLSDVIRGQRSAGPHVIYRDGRGGGWLVFVLPCAGLGAMYVYFRLRGWQLGDFMYVTKGSLATLRSTVTDSFTRIWDYMGKQKEEFVSRFTAIGQQQERLMTAQNDMDVRLREVGEDVSGIAGTTTRIEGQVDSLDGRMAEVDSGVKYANQGIILLCQAMSDITHRLNFNVRSADALKSYAQATPMLGSQGSMSGSHGLRGLLGGPSLALLPPEASGASAVAFPPLPPPSSASVSGGTAPALQYGRPPCLVDSSPSSTSSSINLTPPLPPRSGASHSMSVGPVSGGGGSSSGGPPNFSIGGRAMSALGQFFPRNGGGGGGAAAYTEDVSGHLPLPKARTSSVVAS